MRCLIPGSNLKVFGKAVHCLAKFGEDLYFEPSEKGLALKTVNSSRSAYGYFLFSRSFFIKYDEKSYGEDEHPPGDDEESFKCRITAKSCLRIFRSPSALEKNVDRCQISLNAVECRLVFQLNCKHGIMKTFNLTYQETETLQAVFSKDLCPNRITANSKVLSGVFLSFKISQDEVTMTVNPSELTFKNYVEDEPDPTRVTHSELKLSPEEFTEYSIGVDTEVTFCLKEMKAILSFADATRLPVLMRFETTGKPIVFSVESESNLEATFVLATLADVSSSQASEPPSQIKSKRLQKTAAKSSQAAKDLSGGRRIQDASRHAVNEDAAEESNDKNDAFPDEDGWKPKDLNETRNIDKQSTNRSPVFAINSFVEKMKVPPTDTIITPHHEEGNQGTSRMSSSFLANFEETEMNGESATEHRLRTSLLEDSEDEDDEFDFVPSTPPAKKFKSMFFGASQSVVKQSSQNKLSSTFVLAEDTDDEDE